LENYPLKDSNALEDNLRVLEDNLRVLKDNRSALKDNLRVLKDNLSDLKDNNLRVLKDNNYPLEASSNHPLKDSHKNYAANNRGYNNLTVKQPWDKAKPFRLLQDNLPPNSQAPESSRNGL